jgi:hypothetical protein
MSAGAMKQKGQAKQVKGKVKRRSDGPPATIGCLHPIVADVSEDKGQSALGDAGQKVKKITKKIVGKR